MPPYLREEKKERKEWARRDLLILLAINNTLPILLLRLGLENLNPDSIGIRTNHGLVLGDFFLLELCSLGLEESFLVVVFGGGLSGGFAFAASARAIGGGFGDGSFGGGAFAFAVSGGSRSGGGDGGCFAVGGGGDLGDAALDAVELLAVGCVSG